MAKRIYAYDQREIAVAASLWDWDNRKEDNPLEFVIDRDYDDINRGLPVNGYWERDTDSTIGAIFEPKDGDDLTLAREHGDSFWRYDPENDWFEFLEADDIYGD